MKLSNVIMIWDVLHAKDTGDVGFNDLVNAISEIVGVQNDIPSNRSKEYHCTECGAITTMIAPICVSCHLKESEKIQTIIVPYQNHNLIQRTYPNCIHVEDIGYGRTKVKIAVKISAEDKK